MVEIIIAALVALILGGAAGFFIFRYVIKVGEGSATA